MTFIHSVRSRDYDLECQRCGCQTNLLLRSWRTIDGGDYYEEAGEPVPEELREVFWVCVRCDHDMMNGGPSDIDTGDLLQEREEQEYYEDPINNPLPYGWQR